VEILKHYRLHLALLACLIGSAAAAQPSPEDPCNTAGGAGACLVQISALMARQAPVARAPASNAAKHPHAAKPATVAEAAGDPTMHLRMSEHLSQLE
jgi:hypothetical protein